jgi:hypothetical protein
MKHHRKRTIAAIGATGAVAALTAAGAVLAATQVGATAGRVSRAGIGLQKIVPPKCTAADTRLQRAVVRRDLTRFCGPASAVVWSKGRWRVIDGGSCTNDRLELHFGVLGPKSSPHMGLSLVLDPPMDRGWTEVPGAELELVPGTRESLTGTAVQTRPTGGIFRLWRPYPTRSGGRTFIGAWSCG